MSQFHALLIPILELAERHAVEVYEGKAAPQDIIPILINAIDRSFPNEAKDTEHVIAQLSAQYDEIKKEKRPYSPHYASLLADIAEHFGFSKWIGWTNHDLGKILNEQGYHIEAEQAFRRSISAFNDGYSGFAAVVKGDLGSTLRRLGRFADAEPLLRDALEAALHTDIVHNQIEWKLELGNTLVFMGRNRDALPVLQDGLQQARSEAKLKQESGFLTAIANIYENLGRYDECIALHHEALAVSRQTGEKALELEDHRGIGNLHLRFGQYEKALASYQTAYLLARELRNKSLQAPLLESIGSLAMQTGNIEKGINILEQALEETQRLGLQYTRMRVLGNLGNTYVLQGNLEKARHYHEQSLHLSRQTQDTRSLVWDLMNLGDVYLKISEIKEALQLAEEALGVAGEIDDPLISRSAEWLMARVLNRRGNVTSETIWGHYLRAIEALEYPRQHVAKDEDRVGLYGGGKYRLYEDAVLWLLEQNNVELAFEIAERAKSRLLIDALSERAKGAPSRPASATVLLDKIRAAAPGSALVSFFMTMKSVAIFCTTQANSTVDCIQLNVSISDLQGWIEQWQAMLDRLTGGEDSPADSLPETIQTLAKLDDLVVHAVRAWLEKHPEIKRVVIIPHLLLHAIPWHLAYAINTNEYFVEQIPISYLPATQLLQATRPVNSDYTILVVSEPQTDLVPLPGARAEADAIKEMFNCTVLSDSDATVEAFINHAADVNIIHLGCHGQFNSARPELSCLVLANNEPLSVESISAMHLSKLQLVIVAACYGGLSRPGGLDEALGLSRAWLLAGATTVLSALWSVHDDTTKNFMIAFYKLIQDGGSFANAYRSAQQRLMNGNSFERDPRMWGAFTLIDTSL